MSDHAIADLAGQCSCGAVQYELLDTPLFVHCCHCTWCQRETGSAFAINVLIETEQVRLVKGEVDWLKRPSNSGQGQDLAFCWQCGTILWSHYKTAKERIAFVRAGTLLDASKVAPDIHIYTATKLPWVEIPLKVQRVQEIYDLGDYWPENSIKRFRKTTEKIAQKI
ncbi:MAG: GFA family protein [Erythrobacter sp.]